MAEGGAPVTPISKAGVAFPAGTVADPVNVAGGTAGGPATIADGADVTQGAIADAAVAAGATGTVSAKLRRLTTDTAAVLAKLSADPATEASLAAVLAKLSADPATQATLADVLAKLTADPATQTTLAAILALIPTALGAGGGLKVDGSGTPLPVSGTVTANLGTIADVATQTTLAAVLAALASVAVTGPQTDAQFIAALKSSTATHSSVASGTSSVTILASNANRKGARIFNSDANALYLDLSGGTAVAASRAQVKLATDEGHTVDAGYTGAITGIWAGDGSGAASVVEFTV